GEELRADLAAFLAATTPQTDAARLAAFLRPLFHDIAESEREQRELLMKEASGLLAGAFSSQMPGEGPAPEQPAPGTGGRRPPDTVPRPDARAGPARRGGLTPAGREPAAGGPTAASDGRPDKPPGEDPRIGTTLGGRYLIERLCGEGAMGRVYEA